MDANSFDVLVIGGGPGGYVAAIRAAQLGFRTALVEKQHLGGICLNWGCIPTKTLLRSAELFEILHAPERFGLSVENMRADLAGIVKRSREVASRLNDGVKFLMQKNRISVVWGSASFEAPGRVVVRSSESVGPPGSLGPGIYEAAHVVIATGARPRTIPMLRPDKKIVWTYFDALTPSTLPSSLLIVGSGAIGVEFASFYRALGSDVTLVEVKSQILPGEDPEISILARKAFEKRGIRILTGAEVRATTFGEDDVLVEIAHDGSVQSRKFDRIISAVGVVGNVEGLGLEQIGVRFESGCIAVHDHGRTTVPGVYAIGDVAGPPMLAHKAEHEGVQCIEAIKGLLGHSPDRPVIPACTYSSPQIASVGLTEEQAKARNIDVRIGRFPFSGNGKAIALGEDVGFVKVVFDREYGQLLGAHMVGPDVTELIHGIVLAMNLETTEADIMRTIFPHPTLSEAVREATLDAYGIALNR